MAKGNPNDESMKLNFIPKVWDDDAKEFKPFYIPPDSTDVVRGDVYLSDNYLGDEDAETGVTAATPRAVQQVAESLGESAKDAAEAAKAAAEVAEKLAESLQGYANDTILDTSKEGDQSLNGNLIPSKDGEQTLGNETNKWGEIWGDLKGNADTATKAEEADHAADADHATEADHAADADHATSADSADKLDSMAVGDSDTPVYFEDGIPKPIEKVKDSKHADTATNADHATTADKLGAETVGGVAQGIYLVEGVATAKSANIGSEYSPSYLLNGVDTAASSPSMTVNLASSDPADVFTATPSPGVTGILGVTNGGTGVSSLDELFSAMQLGDLAKLSKNNDPEQFLCGDGTWQTIKNGGMGGMQTGGEELSTNELNTLKDDKSASTGKAIEVAPNDNKELSKQTFELPFGGYSVVVRAKVTNISDSNDIFQIAAYAGDALLKTVNVKPNYFSKVNTWRPIGIGVDFAADAPCNLVIVLKSLGSAGAATAYIDSVTVMLAPVAVNMIG